MDLATIIGLLIATLGILGGFVIEGGDIAGLFNIPGLMIVVVGTLGATMVSFPIGQFMKIPKLYMIALFGGGKEKPGEMSNALVDMAEKARREGLLSLEDEVHLGGLVSFR